MTALVVDYRVSFGYDCDSSKKLFSLCLYPVSLVCLVRDWDKVVNDKC